jgi:hypothetical protein
VYHELSNFLSETQRTINSNVAAESKRSDNFRDRAQEVLATRGKSEGLKKAKE